MGPSRIVPNIVALKWPLECIRSLLNSEFKGSQQFTASVGKAILLVSNSDFPHGFLLVVVEQNDFESIDGSTDESCSSPPNLLPSKEKRYRNLLFDKGKSVV